MNVEDPKRDRPLSDLEARLWDTEVERNVWEIRYKLLKDDVGWLVAASVLGGTVFGICITRAWWGL